MRSTLRSLGPAGIGVALNLVLAAMLTAFLLSATHSGGDAVPRPFVLAALLATPAVIAAIGIARRRRSLLLAAGVPLIPASFLSFALVTLPFAIVALLYAAGAASIQPTEEPRTLRVRHAFQAATVAFFVVAAGWVVLFGLTVSGCFDIPGGTECGESFTSAAGAAVAAILLIGAIVLALVGRRPSTAA